MFDPNPILLDPKFRHERRQLEMAWRFGNIAPLMDPTLSKSQRQKIKAKLLEETHEHPWLGPVSLSERSLRRWCCAFKKNHLSGLTSKKRNEQGISRVIPIPALELAQKLLQEDPRRTVASLVNMVLEEKPEWRGLIARSTLDRHLRRLGKPPRNSSDTYLRFEASDANDLWQGDILHGSLAIHEGKEFKAKWVCWIDDHSRLVLDLQAFPDERFPVIEASLKRAILKHGRPSRILVDNGQVYSGHSLTLACAGLSIYKAHSAPYHPQSKGKVEKFFQLFRRQFLNEIENIDPMPFERLNRLAGAWLNTYHDRPHKSLEGTTPRQRYQPKVYRSVTIQALEEAFWQWEHRTVSSQGRIEFHKGHYFVDLSFANQKVIVRYDPFDLSRIILWHEGCKVAEATATELVHRTKPRKDSPVSTKRSDASKRFIQTLEQTQQERMEREVNLTQLPDAS
jgi:putative transposase